MEQRMSQKYLSPFSLFDEIENLPWAVINSPASCQQAGQGLQVSEDEQHIIVEASMPGLNEEDIDVTFEKGNLTIRGEKKETEEDKMRKYYRRSCRSFAYTLQVPGNVDETAEPQAEFKTGVLKISFPKQRRAPPKKIEIKKK